MKEFRMRTKALKIIQLLLKAKRKSSGFRFIHSICTYIQHSIELKFIVESSQSPFDDDYFLRMRLEGKGGLHGAIYSFDFSNEIVHFEIIVIAVVRIEPKQQQSTPRAWNRTWFECVVGSTKSRDCWKE